MPSTYSNLKIQLMATGENNTTWGNVTNINLGTAIEEAIVGSVDVAFSSADVTLTLTDTNAAQSARNLRLNLTGAAVAGYNLVVPAIEKPYIINNGTTGTVTVKNATGTGIAVPTGKTMWVYNNGTNVVDVATHLTSLTLGSALPILSGGTGGTTQSAARSGLGSTTVGDSFFTLTNPSAVTFPRINANNTVSTLDAATFRTAIGAGTSSTTGTVTSVNASGGTTGLTLSGGPVTTTGTFTLAGTLAVANGGTGQTTYTNGQLLIGNTTGNTLTKATLTAGSGISVTNGTGTITIAATGGSGTVTSVAGAGTVNGLTLTGTVTTSGSLTLGGTLSGIANSALTNSAITINGSSISLGGSVSVGTVTSVAGTGSANGLSLSGTVTSTGNITLSGSVTSVNATATIDGVTIGYRSIPRSTTSGTAVVADVGKCIAVTAGITIPNSTFAAGDAISIYNDNVSTAITITAGVTTLRLAGTATTGNRTLAARGLATIWFNSATEAIISGAGVS
jgi:hypothetical protein